MAQKVLNAGMGSLVKAMKLVLQYNRTVLDEKYRREMLQAAHVIAFDSKNLLDTVDTARRIKIYLQQTSEEKHSKSTETQYSPTNFECSGEPAGAESDDKMACT